MDEGVDSKVISIFQIPLRSHRIRHACRIQAEQQQICLSGQICSNDALPLSQGSGIAKRIPWGVVPQRTL